MELLSGLDVREHNVNYCGIGTLDLLSWNGKYIQLAIKFSYSLSQGIGWTVFVRVDGLTYWFLGFETGTGNVTVPNGVPTTATGGAVDFTNLVITPTQTVIVAQAGPMQVNLTFLNPIEVRFTPLTHSVSYIYII